MVPSSERLSGIATNGGRSIGCSVRFAAASVTGLPSRTL